MTSLPSEPKPGPSAAKELPALADDNMSKAVQYLIEGGETLLNLSPVGELRFVKDSDDLKDCESIQQLFADYINGNESRPFSIVVFGPPGSGKSFYVRQIVEDLKTKEAPQESTIENGPESRKEKKTLAEKIDDFSEINLSQLYAPHELAEYWRSTVKNPEKDTTQGKDTTKIFFFDEFDSSLEGVSLGWLRWFLAPMQDGKFFYEGQPREFGKCIFIFAGGTAVSLDEFQERARIDMAAYYEKKVPDFISRLRAFVNIRGINHQDAHRPTRRALILRGKLKKKLSAYAKDGKLPIAKDFAKSLLSNAHYIHGIRSMEALLETSSWKGPAEFTKEHLPPKHLMELHVSRGQLSGMRVGISAGLNESAGEKFLIELCDKLFENGADLAYGGNLGEAGTLAAMVKAAKNTPEDLLNRQEKQRIRNYLGYPAYQDAELIALNDKEKDQINVCKLSTLSDPECNDLGVPSEGDKTGENNYFPARPREEKGEATYNPKQHMAWSLSLFRMRVSMIQGLSALIAFGGKDDGRSWGRFSGNAEEIMLALAMGKPVYVLGKAGGATQSVGKLLGLDTTLANPDTCLNDIGSIEHHSIYRHFKHAFALPEHPDLPRTIAELRSYLFEYGVTTSAWPWNGLMPEDNRRLFNMEITDPKDCVQLIITGLTRLDWKHSAGT